MTDTLDRHQARSLGSDVVTGAIAGLIGGLPFGGLMAMMAMLPMVGALVASESAIVGFGIHMVISAVIGGIYGGAISVLRLRPAYAVLPGVGIGLAYGSVWWVLGPLLIMPSMMGMGPQFGAALTQMNVMSLMGHLIYGAVTGAAFAILAGRR
ncbi:MAG: hypothetical protein ACT4OQ_06780 [Chloroflexota bacterium]